MAPKLSTQLQALRNFVEKNLDTLRAREGWARRRVGEVDVLRGRRAAYAAATPLQTLCAHESLEWRR